jgi:dihydrofolate reductase
MGRLIVSAQMTMDSVMDQIEGWFDEHGDMEGHGVEELRAADALILGRETYEVLSTVWAAGSGPYAKLINAIPKYVASTTLTGPLGWNAQLLGADTAEAVAEVKRAHEGSLLSYGCGALASFLAHRRLIDEVRFWLHPVIWGDGVRPFHAGQVPVRLRLISASPYSTGVVRLSYQPLAEGDRRD